MAVMPWTSVVSYHTDPDSCGVAKFSAQLAARLGVPLVAAEAIDAWGANPLLSVKWSEWGAMNVDHARHDQLWHDESPTVWESVSAGRIWKLYELGVPSLVDPTPLYLGPSFFTFGMAHKLDADRFARLRARYPGWGLWVSTAAHEGAGPSRVQELLTAWGPRAHNLGHLTDAALQLVWPQVTAFVAFFEHGLRANNSSVHAALNAHKPVITNHGPQTPDDLRRLTYDLDRLPTAPTWEAHLAGSPYTWARLMLELECAKDS